MSQEPISHSLVQTLRAIPDFSALKEEELLSIVGESMNLFWKSGSVIFDVGQPGEALYVVLAGEISIVDPDQGEVARLTPGMFFGEISLLLQAVHSKRALALKDSEILVLPKETFSSLLATSPTIRQHFDNIVKRRRSNEELDLTSPR
jgi:CRP/FNR family cyclic AMP-dependent transcriptional regulator